MRPLRIDVVQPEEVPDPGNTSLRKRKKIDASALAAMPPVGSTDAFRRTILRVAKKRGITIDGTNISNGIEQDR